MYYFILNAFLVFDIKTKFASNLQCVFFSRSLCLTKIYENVTCRFQTRGLTQHMFQHML